MCDTTQWEIDALYEGVKRLGYRVIWSLRGIEWNHKDDPDWWVSPWCPQMEILAHPGLKAGMTHCGFGGTLEFISAGVPIMAFPHFAD